MRMVVEPTVHVIWTPSRGSCSKTHTMLLSVYIQANLTRQIHHAFFAEPPEGGSVQQLVNASIHSGQAGKVPPKPAGEAAFAHVL